MLQMEKSKDGRWADAQTDEVDDGGLFKLCSRRHEVQIGLSETCSAAGVWTNAFVL